MNDSRTVAAYDELPLRSAMFADADLLRSTIERRMPGVDPMHMRGRAEALGELDQRKAGAAADVERCVHVEAITNFHA